jgi:hypothetical protein
MCDQENLKNEEAKARYRAVENTTTMGCNARKTHKQTNNIITLRLFLYAVKLTPLRLAERCPRKLRMSDPPPPWPPPPACIPY